LVCPLATWSQSEPYQSSVLASTRCSMPLLLPEASKFNYWFYPHAVVGQIC
jgi:hypothetical protein